MPFHLETIDAALFDSDLFVAIGTSGAVYPAAGLVDKANRSDICTCEINLTPSDNAHSFDDARYGPASEQVPLWVAEVLAAH
jgi:NAD-dependent deacetylase